MEIKTKNESIYNNLRSDIVAGKFRPGERLVIADLSKRYATSPMPIREALTRLQQDGFIQVEAHVGAHVADFDMDRFHEILLIRTEIEALACRLAVPYITEEILDELDKLVEEMEVCVEDANVQKFSKLNKKLHLTIYNAGPYPILQELICTYWELSEYMRNQFSVSMKRIRESHQEHKEWLAAFRNNDEANVMDTLRKQKEKQFAEYLRVLNEQLSD